MIKYRHLAAQSGSAMQGNGSHPAGIQMLMDFQQTVFSIQFYIQNLVQRG
jgi:hypothetical protein